ncbi:MAG: two-component system, OmpR family, sensor kinase [Actinomycetota bacterium]|nr:two-component system, OmpR family, sensor kinase [Actinomycetota bacterium]
MRRRLTFAIVGVVALALLLSGFSTLVLIGRAARRETRTELVVQARDIAAQASDPTAFRALVTASRALRLEGLSRVGVTRAGVIEGQLPAGVTVADLRLADLAAGREVSGLKRGLAYAAVGVRPPNRPNAPAFTVVVLTRKADPGLGRGATWLLLSSALALVLAAVVADRLGRRITAPLASAEAATRRIAGGDLDARVAHDDANDPELASLADSINTMAASLERSRGLERQFLLAVSHDLRTPLTSIRGFAEAIADGAAPDHEKAAGVISAEARRLERLVGDLLELAKLDARQFPLHLATVDAGEVVGVTAAGFEPEVTELGLTLQVDVPAAPLLATADPDRLAQVVANLVENALKFAASHVAVGVVALDGGGVRIVVDDDGPGIAPEDRPHVFERLYTSARGGGSGLGLAIVAELVAAMGGTVAAVSPASGGTRLEVRLRP